ncbi:MAG: hypothetical protein A2268_12860 [Candidatus Raymondbacteria bacterium RifOxyA12_full_50_37]|uniref:Type II secretion system protein GspF domain-containing protein n=1 Tax=Candidatus Raymondbacteria bacterium RIFOXYD12_FULL_49_13 TaxID=1817890 RepID=A0A1F7FJ31_UNCRA|nr:MAG: hypothetical protein A2268_12860 [Candidatus Raymondbacteria bacterium RifOxyA12_full_50_37]OGJ90773.1 MAG: hypothetical protein A2248_02130 [Candidatus Raymondbacteria bacterium RIFOXYA2_FULL_49_16]OGJ91652.1 MAG: hypothetical protein A2350_00415 [Candidatus Raymondbacteria bacterium RifOxyB12_full_50_8]OGJ97267.1 MAG: hypothetical protein A2487_16320 [Candidatus Raymondbacteria bacterium RifOxyC12_full_50_8]OGJ97340.1 MAG: hypothetical protein A2453_03410 [Candidatus Raymondbacteria b
MDEFNYTAVTAAGKEECGVLSATNADHAIAALKMRQLKNIRIGRRLASSFHLSIPKRDISSFARQLSILVSSRLPLDACMDALQNQTAHSRFKVILASVANDIKRGLALHSALSQHPRTFSALFCAMVRAGESSGNLPEILSKLADYLEKSEAIRRKIIGAMLYPAVVSCVALCVLITLLVFVVPTFQSMYLEMGKDLPFLTTVIITLSALIKDHWGALGICAGLAVVLSSLIIRQDAARRFWDSIKIKVPVLGALSLKSTIARLDRTTATLLAGGVPLVDALRITQHALGNRIIEKAVGRIVAAIESGKSFGGALAVESVFPSLSVQMAAIGEKTGSLKDMLQKAAEYYENDVETASTSLLTILEPLLIVVMGVFVSLVLVGLYLPLFEIMTHVE